MTQAGRRAALLLVLLLALLIALLVAPRIGPGRPGAAARAADSRTVAPRAEVRAPSPATGAGSLASAATVDNGQPTPGQRRCQAALGDVVTHRLRSDEVRKDPRHAAGAVLIGEHLSFVRAFSTGVQPRPVNARLLAQAVARSPDDVPLAWLYAHHCDAPDCDSQQAWARVQALEPANLAAWMLMPYDKARPPGEAETDAWLAQAGRATYADGHFGDFARAMAEAIGPVPALSACREVVAQLEPHAGRAPRMQDLVTFTAHGQAMVYLPSMRRVSGACPHEQQITHRRQAQCEKVMRVLAASNDMILASLGTRWLGQRAQTAADRARWAERMRNLRWAQEAGARHLRLGHLPLVWEQGELAVVIAILEDRGQWPAPPGWQPTRMY